VLAFPSVVEESRHPLDLYKAAKIPLVQNPYDSKFQRKKIKVIDELLANETEYVSSLSHVVDQYMAAASASKLFTKDQTTKIFGNIKSLYEFHLIFHKKLRRTVTSSDHCSVHELVNLFQSYFKHFYLYKAYCTKFDESAKYLQKLYSTSPAHAEVLDKCRFKDKSMVHLPLSSKELKILAFEAQKAKKSVIFNDFFSKMSSNSAIYFAPCSEFVSTRCKLRL